MQARTDDFFAALGRFLVVHRRLTVAAILCATVLLGSQARFVRVETTTEELIAADDPIRIGYDEFRDQFGRDEVILVVVEADELFRFDALERLRRLHEDLEVSVPHIDELTSLVNARSTTMRGDVLVVEEFLETWPTDDRELARSQARALANPIYRNLLISDDGGVTALVLQPEVYRTLDAADESMGLEEGAGSPSPAQRLSGEENAEIVRAVREVATRHESNGFRIAVAGSPVLATDLEIAVMGDLKRSTGLALASITMLLWIGLGRLERAALVVGVVFLALVSTIGAMGALDVPISFGTQIIPSFILAVGVGYALHVLTIFTQRRDEGASGETAAVDAIAHCGGALLLTAVTTGAGLAAFSSSGIVPIAKLGVFGPIGVATAFLYAALLLPPLLAALPTRTQRHHSVAELLARMERGVVALGTRAAERPDRVALVFALLLVLSLAATTRLGFSHDALRWFPEDAPVRRDTLYVDRVLGGSMPLEVVIDTAAEDGLYDPALLLAVRGLGDAAQQVEEPVAVGKALSVADVVEEVHEALHDGRRAFRRIPNDPALVAQELFLFESAGSDDLEDLVDPHFRVARLGLRAGWADALHYPGVVDAIARQARDVLGEGVSVHATGLLVVLGRAFDEVVHSMARSYQLAALLIGPLLVLCVGSLRLGLIALVPNLAPVVLALGVMGILGIPLNALTLLVGSLAFGLAVDDTIHLLYGFRRERARGRSVVEAVSETLRTTGRALLFTSLVLAIGFLGFTGSYLSSLAWFGALASLCVALAFVADVFVLPALLSLVDTSAEALRR